MSLYSQFKTDAELEKSGIVLEYGTNSKGSPIGIRIARAGGANQAYTNLLEAKTKPHKRAIQNETIETPTVTRILHEVFARTVVLGWENVEDENGVAMDFNVDNCVRLFTDLPDLFRDVQEQAQKSVLFRGEILEKDAKN